MPNALYGFSGNEIVSYVKNWVGNASAEFQTMVEQSLPLAEYRFCQMHDWQFLHKRNLSLTVSSGTREYDLSTDTVGYYIAASNITSIFNETDGVYLKKTSLDTIRRMDPDNNDGITTENIQCWAPVGDNTILVYPSVFKDTTLKVDGKITPSALLTLSNYPTIPYRYQETFISYVLALCLERENDDRAPMMKQEFMMKVRLDIQQDMSDLGAEDGEPRIKSAKEANTFSSGDFNRLFQGW